MTGLLEETGEPFNTVSAGRNASSLAACRRGRLRHRKFFDLLSTIEDVISLVSASLLRHSRANPPRRHRKHRSRPHPLHLELRLPELRESSATTSSPIRLATTPATRSSSPAAPGSLRYRPPRLLDPGDEVLCAAPATSPTARDAHAGGQFVPCPLRPERLPSPRRGRRSRYNPAHEAIILGYPSPHRRPMGAKTPRHRRSRPQAYSPSLRRALTTADYVGQTLASPASL